MTAPHHPLLARFAGVPSLVAPELRERFESCLLALANTPHAAEMLAEGVAVADDGFWPDPDSWRASYRPYVVVNGVLQIPIKGILLHDFSFAVGSFATGYVYIWRAFQRGMADPNVRGIALVCHSTGGEVAGCFDLVDRMCAAMAAEDAKPVWAFAHEMAYSAAYAIASVANKIAVSRTGGVGSIGVVTAHVDVSKALADDGYKITFIFAGKHKVDGNSFEPLPPAVQARIQSRIDSLYAVFVASVARNRGMSEREVRATEALTFTASEALSKGLADSIGSLDDALAAFAADLSPDEGDEQMSKDTPAGAATSAAITFTQADIDRVRAEGAAEGTATGRKEGAAAERTRIQAIVGAPEAKGREALAQSLAFDTDLTPEAAIKVIKASPEAKASRLDGMVPAPKVDNAEGGKSAPAAAAWDSIVAESNKANGARGAAR